jgi:hypothetical protein
MEDIMATSRQPDKTQRDQGGAESRSENLLPADDAADDDRFDVAEEVNLDQQSDSARRVGQAPESIPQPAGERATPRPR